MNNYPDQQTYGPSPLDAVVADKVAAGWRVMSQAPYVATLEKPEKKPQHLLHFILIVITFGLWFPVWLIAASSGRRRQTLTLQLDQMGYIHQHSTGRGTLSAMSNRTINPHG